DMKSSQLVQTIYYDDVNKDFDYALQWVVDRKNRMLYGYLIISCLPKLRRLTTSLWLCRILKKKTNKNKLRAAGLIPAALLL
ncbi:MAG: hypothetical protein IIU66_01325, partial [Clostridia bacterium]|nr:hypothetical protein [Clostridia bacterium]